MGDAGVHSPVECGCMHVNSTTAAFEGRTYANYMKQAGYTTGYARRAFAVPLASLCGRATS